VAVVELKVLQGELKGRAVTFERPGCVLFGRATDAALRVENDPFVSRHHFLLEISPPFVLLSDLGSTNGVYVNDRLYGGRDTTGRGLARPASKATFLSDGDQIVVGQNRISVSIDEGAVPGTTARRRTTTRRALPFAGTPTASMGELAASALAGQYQVGPELGRGWMGVVYQAVDVRSGEMVSLKTLVPNVVFTDEAADAFLARAKALGELVHPSLCRQYGVWRDGNVFVSAREYVDGRNLAQLLNMRGGRLGPDEAVPIMGETLDGLVYAIAKSGDIYHRNIKPSNILVSGRGPDSRARVADFGLFHGLEATGLSQIMLSDLYHDAAPYWPRERITWFGRTLPASEVFSVAAVFYELLTGCLPRDGVAELRNEVRKAGRPAGLADFLRVFAGHPPVPVRTRNPDVPAQIAAVIDRALAEPAVEAGADPGKILAEARYPDLTAFRTALLDACDAAGWTPRGG